MVDVVYVLGKNNNNYIELRLSLRSIEMYGMNIDRVFVVGERPDWITNVEHILHGDFYAREINVFSKIMAVCEETDVSQDFLLMNDDFFMMKPFDAETYPYYFCGTVGCFNKPNRWQKVQNKTVKLLNHFGVGEIRDFRVHCPIRYNKYNFWQLKPNLKLDEAVGYSHRLLYGNLFVNDAKKVVDCKLWNNERIMECEQGCISTFDGCGRIIGELAGLFDNPSKYEKSY